MVNLAAKGKSLARVTRQESAKLALRYLPGGEQFKCPLCGYEGRFAPFWGTMGIRYKAICAKCGSHERQRAHLDLISSQIKWDDVGMMLEVAPSDDTYASLLPAGSLRVTCDIDRDDVDLTFDLCSAPFAPQSFDLIVVSHVLEHIETDTLAIAELARLLKPGGQVFVAVPVTAETTVEYGSPNPGEDFHWRACGKDYYSERISPHFESVRLLGSEDCTSGIQPFYYEDRTVFPSAQAPLRPAQEGERHSELVAIAEAPARVSA